MARSDVDGLWKANAYVVKYTMDLFNNYTWDTSDPFNGDQFHQHDDRIYTGVGVLRTIDGTLFNRPAETVLGLQTRYDDINLGLSNTVQRQFCRTSLSITSMRAMPESMRRTRCTGLIGCAPPRDGAATRLRHRSTRRCSRPIREIRGWRSAARSSPPYSARSITPSCSPTPVADTCHSNDARSSTVTEVPGDPATPEGSSPLLVRSKGAEIGIRTKAIPNLDSSISVFYLKQDSELFFDGDTGDTVAGLPSQRTGIEFTNDYRPVSWIHIDSDLSLSRARFLGFDAAQEQLYQSLAGFPQAQIGNAPGNFVYNAPWMVASAGITLGEDRVVQRVALALHQLTAADRRWRVSVAAMNVINGEVGYRFDNGWRIQLDALNLLNSTADQDTYAYG